MYHIHYLPHIFFYPLSVLLLACLPFRKELCWVDGSILGARAFFQLGFTREGKRSALLCFTLRGFSFGCSIYPRRDDGVWATGLIIRVGGLFFLRNREGGRVLHIWKGGH